MVGVAGWGEDEAEAAGRVMGGGGLVCGACRWVPPSSKYKENKNLSFVFMNVDYELVKTCILPQLLLSVNLAFAFHV